MIVGVIADNLGGGSARIGEAIINGLIADSRVTKIIVYSNPRVSISPSSNFSEVNSGQLAGYSKVNKRISFVANLPESAIILNLTNFPIGFRALGGRRELVLLHNAYFFDLPHEVSVLNSPLFVLRNSIARALMLWWRTLFSSPDCTTFMVQSHWMQRLARGSIPLGFAIHVIRPHQWLSAEDHYISPAISPLHELQHVKLEKCWFYPATGEKHKNHNLLLELFSRAIDLNPDIKLILTLPSPHSQSQKVMSRAVELGIANNVINVGWISGLDKNYLMMNSGGIIFLSRFESLGLPLLEIRDLDRPSLVLYSEIAQEILGKNHNFYDLYSADLSIARAERKRFSYDLANGCNKVNEHENSPDLKIEQAYFFDALNGGG